MHPGTSIYVIGAQCTGKTTLVNALFDALQHHEANNTVHRITEVARNVLQTHKFTRDDIVADQFRALELQHLILAAQFDAESKQSSTPILCDRSGIDPLVYAIKYGPPNGRESLEDTIQWQHLRNRMMKSLVIVCPPQREWLTDDGTRLMASSWEDWLEMHRIFCRVLKEHCIPFIVLPDDLLELQDRVDFVRCLWDTALPRVLATGRALPENLAYRPYSQPVTAPDTPSLV